MADVSELMSEVAHKMGVNPMAVRAGADVQNAETDGKTLSYNPSFMSSVAQSAGEDGVRFVVAHELGHQAGGMQVVGHDAEFMADEYAARHLAQVGADFKAVSNVMDFLHALSPEANDTHPAPSTRKNKARSAFRSEELKSDDGGGEGKKANPQLRDLAI